MRFAKAVTLKDWQNFQVVIDSFLVVKVIYKYIQIYWLNSLFQFKLETIAVFIVEAEQYFEFDSLTNFR